LTRNARAPERGTALQARLTKDFGSREAWEKEFRATGSLRGIGWAALLWDPVGCRLFNVWIDEHDRGALAGCPVLLVMDVFEHAFLTDYGTKRAEYIDAFLAAVDWDEAEHRFQIAQARVQEVLRS
jgi:Fe-Mn family superoxide dismutase